MRKFLIIIAVLISFTCKSQTLIDACTTSNYSLSQWLGSVGTGVSAWGQSFTNPSACTLYSVKFYLTKVGTPTGNAYAQLYAHTGTYGTSSTPTNSALATSDNVDVSTLSTSISLVTFNFTGANRYSLAASTYYCITVWYIGGDGSNLLKFGVSNSSSAHSGNAFFTTGSWSTTTQDAIFYIYQVTVAASGVPMLIVGGQ